MPLETRVYLKLEELTEPVTTTSGNISLGGMYLHMPRPAPEGSLVAFELRLGEVLVEGTGEVVWNRVAENGDDAPSGMGVRFRFLSPGSRERIFRLVQHFAQEGTLPERLAGEVAAMEGIPAAPAGAAAASAANASAAAGRRPSAQESSEPAARPEPAPEAPHFSLPFAVQEEQEEEAGAAAGGGQEISASPPAATAGETEAAAEPDAGAGVLGTPSESGTAAPEQGERPAADDLQQAPWAKPERPAGEAPIWESWPDLSRVSAGDQRPLGEPGDSAGTPGARTPQPSPDPPSPPGARSSSPPAGGSSPPAGGSARPGRGSIRGSGFVREPKSVRDSLLPLLVLVLLVLLAVALWVYRQPLAELIGLVPAGDTDPAAPITAPAPSGANAPAAAAEERPEGSDGAPPGAGRESGDADTAGPTAAATAGEAPPAAGTAGSGNDAAAGARPPTIRVGAEGEPAAPEPAAPEPAARATAASASTAGPTAAPLRQVETITWERTAGGTVVTVRGDGGFDADTLRPLRLDGGAPRIVLYLRGVEEGYEERIAVGTEELTAIRTGLHRPARGPELHLVLDLAAGDVELAALEPAGRRLQIVLRRP